MNYLEKAEKLVRDKLQTPPEKEVQGFDYLRVLDEHITDTYGYSIDSSGELERWHWNNKEFGEGWQVEKVMHFNLTTGKPATEKDCEEFIRLVKGV